ncbi:MAG: ABC transporter permease [Desulfuromonadaceae bacterium]
MGNERVATQAELQQEFSVQEHTKVQQVSVVPSQLLQKESFVEKLRAAADTLLSFFQKTIFIALMLLVWEFAPRYELIDPTFIPPLSKVLIAFKELVLSGELLKHTLVSLQRAALGFGIAIGVAIPIGFLIGWFRDFEKFVDPGLQALRQLPTLALFPVFILIFGIGEVSKVAIIFKACFWPVFLNTVAGVTQMDPLMVKSARSMGVSRFGMFRKVVLPATIPSMFSGLRLSGSTSLLILVAAEMMGANAGLGFLIFHSETRFEIPSMYAAILAMTILGIIVNYVLTTLEKRVSRWKEKIAH